MRKIGYLYLVASAVIILILDNFIEIFRTAYSWWLVPLLLAGFTLGFILIQLGLFVLMIFCTDVEKPLGRSNSIFRFLLSCSLPMIIRAARVKINFTSYVDELPHDKKMLFVCNHLHDFDPVVMLDVFSEFKIGFIGKKEIYEKRPFVKRAMHRLNSLPIDRENDREAAKTIIKAINIIKNDVASIALFPEGYTSLSGEFQPFRNGSFKIALKSGCPIVVCVINNTQAIPKNMFRRRTEVDFRCLEIINPEDYEGMNTSELGDMIHDRMAEELQKMKV